MSGFTPEEEKILADERALADFNDQMIPKQGTPEYEAWARYMLGKD